MHLSKDRFYKGSFNLRRTLESAMETTTRYTYESHKNIYDIIDIDNVRYYIINSSVSDKTPYHRAIENHFNI